MRKDRVRWPDGTQVDYYVALRPDVVVVCALTNENEVLLVEQYKHGVGKRTLELPAGALGPGERPLSGAKRELLEETGYRARKWTKVAVLYDDATKNNNRVHVFLGLDAWQIDTPRLEASEVAAGLCHRKRDFDEAVRLGLSGRIAAQSSISALLICSVFLKERRGKRR